MSEPAAAPERLDLLGADDPRDLVHRAVACLAQGGLVALPGPASHVLAAGALHPPAVERLRGLRGKGRDRPLSVGVRDQQELADWVPDAPAEARKLALRGWPGPLTLIVRGDVGRGLAGSLPHAVRPAVAPGATIGLRMPAHAAVREIQDLISGPLVLTDAPDADSLRGVDMILDDGPTGGDPRNSVVEFGPDGWGLARAGALAEPELRRMCGTILLFVCTGNTCRSPMAEAICHLVLADRLGCRGDEVEARGYVVTSAGLAAGRGARAASEAIDVIHARGGSLREHASRPITDAMVVGADLILAMTRDHREAILDRHPDAEPRVHLLHPEGDDVDDPIGCDRDTYRRTAEAIEAYIRAALDEFLAAEGR